jgi:acyl-CoA reductase-like NAD-dependent aldehyde dehydrogenase
MATAVAARVFKNFIGGEWVAPKSGKTHLNCNPANTGEVIGEFPLSSEADVDGAVAAAREAYRTWRLVPAPKRAEILFRAAELLVKRKEEFSRDMMIPARPRSRDNRSLAPSTPKFTVAGSPYPAAANFPG